MENEILDAYFAGLFDGEGSVGVYKVSNGKGTNKKKFYYVRLSIVGTHRPMIEKVYKHFNLGGFFSQKRQALHITPKGNYCVDDATDDIKICKQGWRWSLSRRNEIQIVLNRMLPFINEKKIQVEICLKFLNGEIDGEDAEILCKNAKKFNFPTTDFKENIKRSTGSSGVNNPLASFNLPQLKEIRDSKNNGMTVNDIAKKWNVHRTTIYRVLNNKTYIQR